VIIDPIESAAEAQQYFQDVTNARRAGASAQARATLPSFWPACAGKPTRTFQFTRGELPKLLGYPCDAGMRKGFVRLCAEDRDRAVEYCLGETKRTNHRSNIAGPCRWSHRLNGRRRDDLAWFL
jgi:hypothetical protein